MTPGQPQLFVVSLARDVDRRTSIARQLGSLGIDFEFIDAVDARAKDPDWLVAQVDQEAVLRTVGRPLGAPEIGCALSHRLAYADIIEKGRPGAFIVEDDVTVAPSFLDAIDYFRRAGESLAAENHLYHLYAASNWSGHLVLRRSRPITAGPKTHFYELVMAWSGEPWGTCGYYVTRAAAQTLLESRLIETVADHWTHWARRTHGRIYIAVPAPISHPPEGPESSIEAARRSLIARSDGPIVGRLLAAVEYAVEITWARLMRYLIRPIMRIFY